MSDARIFYFCFDHERRRGGPKQIYRHVTLLRQAGYDAWVVHRARKEPLSWFEHGAEVLDHRGFSRRFDPSRDVAVLPEDMVSIPYGKKLLAAPGRKVIFNQNAFLGFSALGEEIPEPYPYLHPRVIATLCVSEQNRRMLAFAFPRARVLRVLCGVDVERFTFRPLCDKRPWIACQAKAPDQLLSLFHLLRARTQAGLNRLAEFRFITLQGFTEEEAAAVLAESSMLVALSMEEGICLLPIEAMLSGCLVFAHFGAPMDEYLPRQYRHRPGDLPAMAKRLEQTAARLLAGGSPALERLTRSARRRAESFTLEAERRSVLAAWAGLLAPGTLRAPARRRR